MLKTALHWIVPLCAMFVFGPLAAWLMMSLHAADASRNVSLFVNTTPAMGFLVLLGVAGVALVSGSLGASLIGRRTGLWCAGLTLAWPGWCTGRAERVLSSATTSASTGTKALLGSPTTSLAIEGLIVAIVGAALAWLILQVPTPKSDPAAEHHLPEEPRTIFDKTAPVAILVALLAGAVAVWLLAQSTLKGQTLAAGIVGGLFAAAAGRMASQRVSPVMFFAGFVLLGCLGPLAAGLLGGSGTHSVLNVAVRGDLFAPARLMPLEYLAGGFIGIPMGLGWAGSMIERHHPAPAKG